MKKMFTLLALSSLSMLSADPYYQYGGTSDSSVRDRNANYYQQQQSPQYYHQNRAQSGYGNQQRQYYDQQQQWQQQPQYYDQSQYRQSQQPQYYDQNQSRQAQQNWNRGSQQDSQYYRQDQQQQYNNQQYRQGQQQDQRYSRQDQSYYSDDHTKPAVSDEELTRKVREALSSGWFSKGYEGLKVNVSNGQVVISGQVESLEDKNKILEKVNEINGVKRVTSNITVAPSSEKNVDSTKADEMRNKYPKDRAMSAADKDLHAKVRDKISGGWFGRENETLVLVTENGIVTISGTVDKVEDIDNYNKKIKEVEGVKEVRNNLRVKQN